MTMMVCPDRGNCKHKDACPHGKPHEENAMCTGICPFSHRPCTPTAKHSYSNEAERGECDNAVCPAKPPRHGHPAFYAILDRLADLHSVKNKDYAEGGEALGNFDRVAAIRRLYPDFDWSSPFGVAISFLQKQMDAAMWLYSQQKREGTHENVASRLDDVAVYAVIAEILWQEEEASERGI